MKTYRGAGVYLHIFWASALVGGELYAPATLLSGEAPPVPVGQEVG
jgi:hypothetical protein